MNNPHNGKNRFRGTIYPLLAGILIAGVLSANGGIAQESIKYVKDDGFSQRTRPAAVFTHDAHNEKAGVYDCSECHHMFYDGKPVPGEMSIGMECSTCHIGQSGSGRMDLIRAYHMRCKGCHERLRAGPVLCGECHRN